MLLARYFHARIGEVPGFEVGPYPDLSIVTFRYRPQRGDADEFNRRLTAAVQRAARRIGVGVPGEPAACVEKAAG